MVIFFQFNGYLLLSPTIKKPANIVGILIRPYTLKPGNSRPTSPGAPSAEMKVGQKTNK
jgi:hypothetical protein